MKDEDDLLVDEAAKLHRIGMQILGLDILPGFAYAPTRWISRRAPKNISERELKISDKPDLVRDRAALFISNHGELVDSNTSGDGTYRVRGMIHLGRRGYSRPLVTVTASHSSSDGTDVLVRGACQEGWVIKHRHGEKSANLIADALRQPVPESGGSAWPS